MSSLLASELGIRLGIQVPRANGTCDVWNVLRVLGLVLRVTACGGGRDGSHMCCSVHSEGAELFVLGVDVSSSRSDNLANGAGMACALVHRQEGTDAHEAFPSLKIVWIGHYPWYVFMLACTTSFLNQGCSHHDKSAC